MKKIVIWLTALVALAIVLSAAVVVFAPRSNANAQTSPDSAIPQVVQPNVNSETEQQKTALLDQVIALTANWSRNHAKAGWIHVVTSQTQDSDTQNVGPDGNIAPNDFSTEDWVMLDNNGRELEGIFLQRSPDKAIIQVSVLKDGFWRNLTYGDVTAAPADLVYAFDFGFTSVAARLKTSLEKTTVTMHDRTLVRFAAQEKYAAPIEVLGFKAKISATEFAAFFNADGMIEIYQTIAIQEDGTRRITSSATVQSFEQGVEPPVEILDYLSQGAQ